MVRIFGDNPIVELENLAFAELSATKVGANMDLLSTHIWPKLAERSQDRLLRVCKKWGKRGK